MKRHSPALSSTLTSTLLERARDAELIRDLDLSREILSPVWEDIDIDPDFSAFDAPVHAELLRLSGVFLSQFGRSRGLADHQLRAKDILTRAAEIFEAEGDSVKVAESRVALANCYLYSGEVQEYDTVLLSIDDEFSNTNHPVSIQIKLNKVIALNWQGKHDDAATVIESLSRTIKFCQDGRLRAQFHNQAGITYRKIGQTEQSAYHLELAIGLCRDLKNNRVLGQNLNCLAMTCRQAGDSVAAHAFLSEAISVFESLLDVGWLPHLLDTRALIFLDEEKPEAALVAIEESISLFSTTEDYAGLTDAMFTKCRCLMRLGVMPDALKIYASLSEIAAFRIGVAAVDKYASLFSDEIYFIRGRSLKERVAAFRKNLISSALTLTGGKIVAAAKLLGLPNHQTLSDILRNQHPELLGELGLKRRRGRRALPKRGKEQTSFPGILAAEMPADLTYLFNFDVGRHNVGKRPEMDFYFFSEEVMHRFGIDGGRLVAVAPVPPEGLLPGSIAVFLTNKIFCVGKVWIENLSGYLAIDIDEADYALLEDVEVLGVPLGYCPLSSLDHKFVQFDPFETLPN